MYLLRICILSVSLTVSFSGNCQSDAQIKKLNQLDSIAFSALETGDQTVIAKANKLLEASKKYKSGIHEINAYTLLGIVNKNKGYYITSVNHYIKALSVAERINDQGRVSACLSNIGSVYQLQENYVKALEYFQNSLEIEEKLNNPLQKSIRLYNMGESYRELDSMDLSLNYFNRSLIIEKKHNSQEGIAYALLGIADVYLQIDRPVDASIALKKVAKYLTSNSIEVSIMYHLLQGELLFDSKNSDQSLLELDSANQISIENEFNVYLTDIYSKQIEIYTNQEKWQQAVDKYEKYVKLKSELNSIKVKNQLEDLTFQNELNKKELEIELIQEERDLANKNVKFVKKIGDYENRIVWFLVSSFVFILGLIVFGIRRITKNK